MRNTRVGYRIVFGRLPSKAEKGRKNDTQLEDGL